MPLSWRQIKILTELREGKRVKQIASDMNVTPAAITDHMRRARVTLGARTNLQAMAIFARAPIVKKP